MNQFLAEAILRFRPELGEEITDISLHVLSDDIKSAFSKFPVSSIWSKKSLRVLDFACGGGNLINYLKPYVASATGVDISQDAVNAFQAKTGYEAYSLNILNCDITSDSDVIGKDYDVIICCMAYHHIQKHDLVTKKLVERLKNGGWIFVLDFDGSNEKSDFEKLVRACGLNKNHHMDENSHSMEQRLKELGVEHQHGLYPDEIIEEFKAAGLQNIGVERELNLTVEVTSEDLSVFSKSPNEICGKGLKSATFGVLLAAGMKPQ